MRPRRSNVFLFCFLSIIGFFLWYKLTYPQFAFIDLSIDKQQAQHIAENYLRSHYGIDPNKFIRATVFGGRPNADRYLKKALGFENELKFIKKYNYGLFFWKTRFFKENNVDQFLITVSAADGEVVASHHTIPETDARPDYGKEDARQRAIAFLRTQFNINMDNYSPISNLTHIYDQRADHAFSWALKDVYIPWSDNPNDGGAKLITSITVSGEEILNFSKQSLQIPKEFSRYIARTQNIGQNISVFLRSIYLILLSAAIFFVLTRRHTLILHHLKKPCLIMALGLFLTEIILFINGFTYVLFDYPTTSSLQSYLWRFFSNQTLESFLIFIIFLMPILSGESLHYEVFPRNRNQTFLYYFRSTFFSREIAWLILIGYFTAVFLLGLQSVILHFGEQWFNVWNEQRWMTHFSASYLPVLTPLIASFTASLTEETMFRVFGISFGKKIFRNTAIAVIFSSLIWGFCHSSYPIYPMWFRGIEVTFLGVLLSLVFLKFGVIPVLVAHYLFNAFLTSAPFLLGNTKPGMFYSSLTVLLVPSVWAIIAFVINRHPQPNPMTWKLSPHQNYNRQILSYYLKTHPQETAGLSREEVIAKFTHHGWDIAVIESIWNKGELSE